MKLLELSKDERRTLREMGIFHPHPRTRMRAQGILRLSQGLTLQQTADEFMVHLNSVEQWRQRWNKLGLAGLYEGRHTGRPKKWTSEQRQALGELAQSEGGTVVALLRHIERQQEQAPISENTAVRYLKEMNSPTSATGTVKKTEPEGLRTRKQGAWVLGRLDREQRCALLYSDESGFSPNPTVQYGWTRIGQTRSVEPLSHRHRGKFLRKASAFFARELK
jgi:transposase